MSTSKIVVIPGSSRAGSWNVKLAGAISKALIEKGADVTWISLGDYDMPIYNGDLEDKSGVPDNAQKLGKLIESHDGVVLVNPEYNGSITPLMKNTLDWISRDLGDVKPYQNRVFALASCSPGALGGLRSLAHVRDILVSVGADMITPQLAVGGAHDAFDDKESLAQERHQNILAKLCDTLLERTSVLARNREE